MSILPSSTLGILGGGQLGRMFVTAARTMGYDVIVLDPDKHSPAGSLATEHVCASFTDTDALDHLIQQCAVITTEFENIPVESLEYLSRSLPVFPSAQSLAIAQDRIKEKNFIQSLGLSTPQFVDINSATDLNRIKHFTFPAILKTARLGYDGKGQVVCQNIQDVEKAFAEIKVACVLEQKINLFKEVSVVLSRNEQGETFVFPVAENKHVNGILDVSMVPADIPAKLTQQALAAAEKIAEGLKYVGVLAVEFFISTANELLVNEIAPRPHNSGHFTLDACYTSQFEQQLRMICGLPSGDCHLHTPVAMLNLLGDIWPETSTPDWGSVLQVSKASLHLYGKKQPRVGRKMGHINFLADNVADAKQNLEAIRVNLTEGT